MTEYTITDLLNNFIEDSENIDNNLRLAIYYHCIGQTASAVSYYLRTAERSENDKVKYECLLGAAMCFEQQGTRNFTVKSLLQNALTVSANRPEAYYLLSKFYRKEANHYDAYLLASIGEKVAEKNPEPLDFYIGYPGFYSIILEKAESAYPCGLCDESRSLFFRLKDEYISDMTEEDKKYLQDKLSSLGAHGPSYQFRTYEKKDYSKLRYKFRRSRYIEKNHSQVFQDIFILSMLDGKKGGTFLEIGGGFAYHKNNTALLESDFDWKGVSIEFNEICANDYKTYRPNTNVLHANALLLDYSKLIKEYFGDEKVVDYLQLDIEPSANTYEALLSIPFDEYKFRVITYEHDHYVDVSGSYRDKSREYLTKMGYELVVSNIAEDNESPFEDWWVHPDLVDRKIIDKMKSVSDETQNAEDYMLCDTFDWGSMDPEYLYLFNRENFIDHYYEKHYSVKENDVVLDIGANCGSFTCSVIDKNPKQVYAIEPSNKLIEQLTNNTRGKQVVVINKSIDSVEETDKLIPDKNVYVYGHEGSSYSTTTFKNIIENNNITEINFLKCDCEGGEYSIFTEENREFILKNVKHLAAEFHVSHSLWDDSIEKFKIFRDNYLLPLKGTSNFHVYERFNDVDVSDKIFDDGYLQMFKDYWDNENPYFANFMVFANYENQDVEKFWDMTPWPTMEFTTSVPKKGCVVDCVYCPQRILEKSYVDDERYLTLDNFKRAVDKLPQNVRVTFAGFTEPWLNKDCTDMVLYAQERGHPIAVFTTGIGMKVDDVYRIKNVPYDLGPNGKFVLHLPDNERRAKHPITKNYIEVLEAFKQVHHEIQGFYTMAMGTVHDEVKHLFPEAVVPAFWSRAGNLVGEAMLKPELLNLQSEYKSIYHGEEPRTCGCDEHLYHNIMLPNGDVSLCCMDYNLKFIIGNLFEQSYSDIAPKPQSCYDMCRFCENGVKPQ
jgi:FkbM family methyltransferase